MGYGALGVDRMSNNFTYWEKRALRQEKKVNDGAKRVEDVMTRAYRQSQRYLTQQAKELFDRAKNRTGMTEEEVKKILNEKLPVENLVELQRLSKVISNPEYKAMAKQRLTVLAYKERITRLDDLKAKSYIVSKQVADVQLDAQTDFYIDVINDAYQEEVAKATIDRLRQKGVTFEVWNKTYGTPEHEFRQLSTNATKNILESHWLGSNYSKRVWDDTDALAKRLEELFTVESLTGMSEFEMTKLIAKEFDRSIGVARRLIRTEANYMANQAKLKAWKDSGVEHYRLVAILDFRTSDICQKKDGKIYLVSEAVVNGADGNYPPLHPFVERLQLRISGALTNPTVKSNHETRLVVRYSRLSKQRLITSG